MANASLQRVRDEALELSESERADLAHDLVESLDGLPDTDSASAWNDEFLRRFAQVEAGTAETIDRTEFRTRMDKALGGG